MRRFFQVQAPFKNATPYGSDKLSVVNYRDRSFEVYDGLNLLEIYPDISVYEKSFFDNIFIYQKQNNQFKVSNNFYIKSDDVIIKLDSAQSEFVKDISYAQTLFWPNRLLTIFSSKGYQIYRITNELTFLGLFPATTSLQMILYQNDRLYLFTLSAQGFNHIYYRDVLKDGQVESHQVLNSNHYIFSPDGSRLIESIQGHYDVNVLDSISLQRIGTIYATMSSQYAFTINGRILQLTERGQINIYDQQLKVIWTTQLSNLNSYIKLMGRPINQGYIFRSNNNRIMLSSNTSLYLVDTEQLNYVELQMDMSKTMAHGFVINDLIILIDMVLEYTTFRLDKLQYYIDPDSMRVRRQLSDYLLASGETLPPEMLEQVASQMY